MHYKTCLCAYFCMLNTFIRVNIWDLFFSLQTYEQKHEKAMRPISL